MLSLTIHNLAPNVAEIACSFSIVQDYARCLSEEEGSFQLKAICFWLRVSLSKDRLLFALSVIILQTSW